MPLLQIINNHAADVAVAVADPNAIWNERTKLLAGFMMSLSYVTATASLVGVVSMRFSHPSSKGLRGSPRRRRETVRRWRKDLVKLILMLAVAAFALFFGAWAVLGTLK